MEGSTRKIYALLAQRSICSGKVLLRLKSGIIFTIFLGIQVQTIGESTALWPALIWPKTLWSVLSDKWLARRPRNLPRQPFCSSFRFHHKQKSMASVGHSPYTSKPSPLARTTSQTPITPSNLLHASPSPIVPNFPFSQPPTPMKRPLPPENHGSTGGPPERKFSVDSGQGDHGSQQPQKKKRVSLSCAQCELLSFKKPARTKWKKKKLGMAYFLFTNLTLYHGWRFHWRC